MLMMKMQRLVATRKGVGEWLLIATMKRKQGAFEFEKGKWIAPCLESLVMVGMVEGSQSCDYPEIQRQTSP